MVTPEFFRQTKLSTASVSSISTLTTDGSGSISGLNAEGSPSPNLMANSPSKPEKRIFGGGQVGLPWWNSGTASGPGFSSGSIKTNSPSELGKFSVARAASGLQNQAPAQHTGFQVGSDHSLNSTTGMLSLGLIPLTDARTSPSNEAETAPQELPSTIRVRVMVAEPKRTPDVILPDCAVSSYYKTQTGDTKRRLLIINNDDGELLLDTALMKTVGFFKTLGGAAVQGLSNDGKSFKCVVYSTDSTEQGLDPLLEAALPRVPFNHSPATPVQHPHPLDHATRVILGPPYHRIP